MEAHLSACIMQLAGRHTVEVASNAAEEAGVEGKKYLNPYWRTLKAGGIINEKYPGGIDRQRDILEKEGHRVIQKGKRYLVVDFEKRLAQF